MEKGMKKKKIPKNKMHVILFVFGLLVLLGIILFYLWCNKEKTILKVRPIAEDLSGYSTSEDTISETDPVTCEDSQSMIYSEDDIRNMAESIALSHDNVTEQDVIELIDRYSNISIEKLAKELGISEEELRQLIVENREYTDALYIELSKKLDFDADDIKRVIGQVNTNTWNIKELAEKLGMTEKELSQSIIDSRKLSQNEIAAVADKLNKNTTYLEQLIDQNKYLTETGVEDIAKELGMSTSELYALIMQNQAVTTEKIDALAKTLSVNSVELKNLIDSNKIVEKEALLRVQNSIQESINAESENRETAVNKAISDLNYAIAVSQDEDAKKLQEVKEKLENSLNDGLSDIEDVLNQVNEQIDLNINELTTEIEKLNSTVTQINSSVSDSNIRISSNENNIIENKTAINGLNSKKAEIYYSITDGVPTLIIDNVIKEGE